MKKLQHILKRTSVIALSGIIAFTYAMPVFAIEKPPLIENVDKTVESDVTVETFSSGAAKYDAAVSVENPDNTADTDVVFHVKEDDNGNGGNVNVTVKDFDLTAPVVSGLNVTNIYTEQSSTTAIIENNVNLNMNTVGNSDQEFVAVRTETTDCNGTATAIIGGDINFNVGDYSGGGKIIGAEVVADDSVGSGSDIVVGGNISVTNNGMSETGDYGLKSNVTSSGSSYSQINGSIIVNTTHGDYNNVYGVHSTISGDGGNTSFNGIPAELHGQEFDEQIEGIDNLSRGYNMFSNVSRTYVGGIVSTGAMYGNSAGATFNADNGISVNDLGSVSAGGLGTSKGLTATSENGGIVDTNVTYSVEASGKNASGVDILTDNGGKNNAVIGGNVLSRAIISNGSANGVAIGYNGVNGNTDVNLLVKGNIEADSSADNCDVKGITVVGAENTNQATRTLNARVKGDVISSGEGIHLKSLTNSVTDIVVEGTLTGNSDAVVVTEGDGTDENFTLTVWKIENTKENGALFGTKSDTSLATDETSVENIVGNVQYIIKVDSPEIALMSNSTTAWGNKKTLSNGEGVDPTVYNVANEDNNILLHFDKPAGKQIKSVYADSAKTVTILPDGNGDYWFVVPRGGGVILSVEFEDEVIPPGPIDPVDPIIPDPINPVDPIIPDPVNPVQPVEPIVPVDPAEPSSPVKESDGNAQQNGDLTATPQMWSAWAMMILNAPANGTVTINMDGLTDIPSDVFQAMMIRQDVTVGFAYLFNGLPYLTTVPANSDMSAYLGGSDIGTILSRFGAVQI